VLGESVVIEALVVVVVEVVEPLPVEVVEVAPVEVVEVAPVEAALDEAPWATRLKTAGSASVNSTSATAESLISFIAVFLPCTSGRPQV
jgi:hypothetical protein